MDLSQLSDFLGVASAAVSGASTFLGLFKDKRHPVARAVSATAAEFGDTLPGLADQLAAFLSSAATKATLRKLSTEAEPSLDRIVAVFCESEGFFFEGPDDGRAIAENVLRRFMAHLERELLGSEGAIAYHDEKEEQRYQLLAKKVEAAADRATTTLGAELAQMRQILDVESAARTESALQAVDGLHRSRVAQAYEQLEKEGPRQALGLFEALYRDLHGSAELHHQALFETLIGLATAKWMLHAEREAAELFRKAAVLQPSDIRATRGLAIAWLGEDDFPKAHEQIDRVIADHPNDAKSIGVKANILLRESRFEAVRDLLGGYLTEEGTLTVAHPGCCRVLAYTFTQFGEAERGVPLLEQAIGLGDSTGTTKGLLADILTFSENARGMTRDSARLDRALVLYEEAFLHAQAQGDVRVQATTRRGQALALIGLDRRSEALDRADAAFRLAPEIEEVRHTYAVASVIACNREEAIARIDRVAIEHKDEGVAGVLIGLLKPDDLPRVRKLLVSVAPTKRLEDLESDLLVALGCLVIAARQVDEADRIVTVLKARDEGLGVDADLLRVRLLLKQGLRVEAQRHAEQLVDRVGDDGLSAIVANIFLETEGFADAVAFYRRSLGRLDSSRHFLRPYIRALYGAGPKQHEDELLRLCRSFRERFGADPAVTKIEIWMMENRLDFSEALKIWPKLINLEPANLDHRVGRARCLFRLGELDEARVALAEITSPELLSTEHAIRVAEMHAVLGDRKKATRIGYQAWRRGHRDQRLSKAFVMLFFRSAERDDPILVPDVAPGTATRVRFDDGSEKTYVILGVSQGSCRLEV